jgi:lipoprotein signal peptidase
MARVRLPVVIAAVVVADQAVKWWAWRHVDGVLINSGGYILLGPAVRSWFAHPVGGAVFDVVGVAALIVSGWWLIRRPRAPGVLLGGGLIIGGWTSNILDRLGLHNWTAPGSARGVVDFIPDGTPGRSNTADVCIAVGAAVLGATLLLRHREPPPASYRPGARAYVAALIVLAVAITLAVTSAIDHKGRYEPSAAPTAARPTCPDDQAGSVKSSRTAPLAVRTLINSPPPWQESPRFS